MKRFLSLFSLTVAVVTAAISALIAPALIGPAATAQDINVVSVSPAVGAIDVPLETQVEFVFDDTLNVEAEFGDEGPLAFFAIEPADSIAVGPPQFSEDATSVTFDVTHTADTDFTWILTGAASHEGGRLCDFGILSYSTASSAGTAIVDGEAGIAFLTKGGAECSNGHNPITVALLDREPGPDAHVVLATALSDVFEFEMTGVRAGTYWPVMLFDADLDGLVEPDFGNMNDFSAEIGAYRPGGGDKVSSLDVSASSRYTISIFSIGGAVSGAAELPGVAALTGNHPNPFRSSTEIGFRLERPMTARLEAYDVLGRLVASIEGGTWPAGDHSIRWDAPGAASGLYFVRLIGPEFMLTRAVVKRP